MFFDRFTRLQEFIKLWLPLSSLQINQYPFHPCKKTKNHHFSFKIYSKPHKFKHLALNFCVYLVGLVVNSFMVAVSLKTILVLLKTNSLLLKTNLVLLKTNLVFLKTNSLFLKINSLFLKNLIAEN